MGNLKLPFSTIIQDAGVRVFAVPSANGELVTCEIHWPRTRQRKRVRHCLGLARLLPKTMIVEHLLPPLVTRLQEERTKPAGPRLSRMIEEFLSRQEPSLSPKTVRFYRQGLAKFLAYAGDRPLTEIVPPLIESFKDTFATTPCAVNMALRSLHRLFEKAIVWGHADHNPLKRIESLRQGPSRARMLSDEERGKLLAAARADTSPVIYKFILWQLNTALRPSESLGLREGDINLQEGILRLPQSKTGEGRWVKLAQTAQDLVWALWQGDGGPLFRGRTGKALDLDNVRRAFRRVLKQAGLRLRLYDLRHDALSRAGLRGVSIPALQALAGHQTLAMVNRYMHLQPGYLDQAVQAIEVRESGDEVVTTAPDSEAKAVAQPLENTGAGEWGRTTDLLITNQLLYH